MNNNNAEPIRQQELFAERQSIDGYAQDYYYYHVFNLPVGHWFYFSTGEIGAFSATVE